MVKAASPDAQHFAVSGMPTDIAMIEGMWPSLECQ